MKFSPIIHWIPDIVFNFCEVLRKEMISDLTLVASEFKILFLQWGWSV